MDVMEKVSRKVIRRDANFVAGGLILYNVIVFLLVGIYMVAACIGVLLGVPGADENEQIFDMHMERYMEDYTSSIIAVILATLFLVFFFRKRISKQDLFKSEKKMTAVTFWELLCVFMLGQVVFNIGGEWLEKLLNVFGYSALESMESASEVSTTWSLFLYASFIGPVVEEVVYRGFVLRSFEKYGRILAIVVSAILFGVMHGNLPQGIFAAGIGLVLGYVALEYSIVWAIVLHIVNNFIFSDLLGMMTVNWSIEMQDMLYMMIFAFFIICSLFIFWKRRKLIKQFFKENQMNGRVFLYIITTVGMVIFIVINLLLAFGGLTVMETTV